MQFLEAAPTHTRVGIAHRRHDTGDAGVDDAPCTRTRASEMAARFERHIQSRPASSRTSVGNGVHFRVRLACTLVPAVAYDDSVGDEHGADHRIRRRAPLTARRMEQRACHEVSIGRPVSASRNHHFS
jgi:hypothetical protein